MIELISAVDVNVMAMSPEFPNSVMMSGRQTWQKDDTADGRRRFSGLPCGQRGLVPGVAKLVAAGPTAEFDLLCHMLDKNGGAGLFGVAAKVRFEPRVTNAGRGTNSFCRFTLVLEMHLALTFSVNFEAQHIWAGVVASLIKVLTLATNNPCIDARND